jgi:poly(3-hydroxybutyrate) depolymerase
MSTTPYRLLLVALLSTACGGDDTQEASTTLPASTGASAATMADAGADAEGTATGDDGSGPTSSVSNGSDGSDGPGSTGATSEPGTDDDVTGDPGYDGEPGDFTLSFDGRDYRMYVPTGYAHDAAIPVVVGFHGAGDSGGNFYQFTQVVGMHDAAEPAAYILIVPDTKSPLWDWANWSGNPNNDIDAMLTEMDEVIALVDDVATHYNVDAQQHHAFGFSNGGLFSGITGLARADTWATLTILGYGWGGSYLPPGPPSRQIPVQFGCGSADGFYGNAQAAESYLAAQGHDTRLVTANGVGHMFTGIMGTLSPADMFAWMQARPLP